ncbi:hypothetical protein [Gracilimonas tropica]|uniref:hypothetical protein n=1 Tax=Gracilimonas tropica TaxID=454600 RepID=UPI00037975D2|nr:hypothetical protein [Gracilimonas tropica]
MNGMNLHQNGSSKSVNVTLEDLEIVACKCGSQLFEVKLKVGRLSQVHPKNKTGEPMLADLPVKVCAECGKELEV